MTDPSRRPRTRTADAPSAPDRRRLVGAGPPTPSSASESPGADSTPTRGRGARGPRGRGVHGPTQASTTHPAPLDPDSNHRAIASELQRLRTLIEQRATATQHDPLPRTPIPTLDALAAIFELTSFERDLLLCCAGVELDGGFATTIAEATTNAQSPTGGVTFSLALAALAQAHWSAITPARPLRTWRLLEPGSGALTAAPLRIDEAILHVIVGLPHEDERLRSVLRRTPRPESDAASPEVPVNAPAAERLARQWSDAGAILIGPHRESLRALARAASTRLPRGGMNLAARDETRSLPTVDAVNVPALPAEQDALARLLSRHVMINGGVLFIDAVDVDGATRDAALHLGERLSVPWALFCDEAPPHRGSVSLVIDLPAPTATEAVDLWRDALRRHAPAPARKRGGRSSAKPSVDDDLDRVAGQFRLGPAAIDAIAQDVIAARGAAEETSSPDAAISNGMLRAASAGDPAGTADSNRRAPTARLVPSDPLWDACVRHARRVLDGLGQRVEPRATWNDLVLPEPIMSALRELASHAAHRLLVLERWGFDAAGRRDLGVTALFSGPSGVGKSLAAEVLAHALGLDLFRIDLSAVVSKYIGETEKNLRRVFDAAEAGGAVLLFDEADALFGKRSEVRDSHDRYANIEVSYLLQRMERYRGVAILTTNHRGAIDKAFLRRLRFVVEFPFPELAQRVELWRRAFPAGAPIEFGERFDDARLARLARLAVTGGSIANIALGAAYAAAEESAPIGMRHVRRAAVRECEKLERPVSEVEMGGWA